MASLNNPAGRLWFVLNRATGSGSGAPNVKASEGWAVALDVSKNDPVRLFRCFSRVQQLPAQVDKEIRKLENLDHDLHLSWIPNVEKALSQYNFDQPFSNHIKSVDATTLSLVAICDDQLSRQRGEPEPDAERLESLANQVDELLEEVSSDNMSCHVKAHIAYHLNVIRQSIDDYRYDGIEALRVGLDTLVGASATRRKAQEEAEKSKYGKKLRDILGLYVLVVTAVIQTAQLPGELQKLLPNDSDSAEAGSSDAPNSDATDASAVDG